LSHGISLFSAGPEINPLLPGPLQATPASRVGGQAEVAFDGGVKNYARVLFHNSGRSRCLRVVWHPAARFLSLGRPLSNSVATGCCDRGAPLRDRSCDNIENLTCSTSKQQKTQSTSFFTNEHTALVASARELPCSQEAVVCKYRAKPTSRVPRARSPRLPDDSRPPGISRC